MHVRSETLGGLMQGPRRLQDNFMISLLFKNIKLKHKRNKNKKQENNNDTNNDQEAE